VHREQAVQPRDADRRDARIEHHVGEHRRHAGEHQPREHRAALGEILDQAPGEARDHAHQQQPERAEPAERKLRRRRPAHHPGRDRKAADARHRQAMQLLRLVPRIVERAPMPLPGARQRERYPESRNGGQKTDQRQRKR
jgi:hypothetical protein